MSLVLPRPHGGCRGRSRPEPPLREAQLCLLHIPKPPFVTGTVVAAGLQNTSRVLAHL